MKRVQFFQVLNSMLFKANCCLDLIAAVKTQHLNMALLWEAMESGKPPVSAATQMNESSSRLDDCIQRVFEWIEDEVRSVN
jgi:hypothetical protein